MNSVMELHKKKQKKKPIVVFLLLSTYESISTSPFVDKR